MATDQEVRDACRVADDNVDLAASLANLTSIFGGTGAFDIIIARDGVQFNLSRLKAILESQGDDFDLMVTDAEAAMLTAIGATDATAGSLRKAIADLIIANDATIAGT